MAGFRPSLRQLEYVVAVAETGQFVLAARQCGVSQPALSKQVREVEDLLGVELFERTRPRVIVTPVGAEVVRRARGLLAGAHELVEVAAASARVRRGTVRLGVIPTIAPYGLPGLLARLRELYPEVFQRGFGPNARSLIERRLRSNADDGDAPIDSLLAGASPTFTWPTGLIFSRILACLRSPPLSRSLVTRSAMK